MKSEKTDLHNPHPIQKRKVFPIEILSNYIIRTLDSKFITIISILYASIIVKHRLPRYQAQSVSLHGPERYMIEGGSLLVSRSGLERFTRNLAHPALDRRSPSFRPRRVARDRPPTCSAALSSMAVHTDNRAKG